MKKMTARELCTGACVGALYAALTILLAPIGFGSVQLRVSEALTLAPIFSAASVPGLFVGCFLSNLLCGAPWQDVVFGSFATLLAAILTRVLRRKKYLAALMPVVCNGLIVGLTLSYVYALPPLITVLTVALGEAAACYLLGLPLCEAVKRWISKGEKSA